MSHLVKRSILLAAAAMLAATITPTTTAALNADGQRHLARYNAMLEAVKGEVAAALPEVDHGLQSALDQATEAVQQAGAAAAEAQKNLGTINSARGLVGHARNKWIREADQGIARARAALENATNAEQRAAAESDLARWEENREQGVQALAERQAALDAALVNEERFNRENEAAQSALRQAREAESAASKRLLDALSPTLGSGAMDLTLMRGAILAHATPAGLAAFAQADPAHAAIIDALLNDETLMREMLEAGGAIHGEWGNAAKIFAAIQQASPRAAEGHFRRLAVGTAVVHARPIAQSKPAEPADAPDVNVDPVKRYLHYEKAFLDGELDPAFEHLTAWEYRHVVNCQSPDEILQWGRTMLRNYRPDHIYNGNYAWRYVVSVRTEVPYGSQNVHLDDPKLHQFQNIICNGGVCGRRAFFGRFILRSFGIPTWGVTQRAHAAVGHWTPDGWVTVLGAGFHASWWDRDDVSMSGNQFLLETQARAHPDEFIKALRAQWISRILGEQAYNDRRNVAGGFWSRASLYQQRVLASTARTLDPVGQELAEANEREQQLRSEAVAATDKEVRQENGVMIVPAVAHGQASGRSAAMKSIAEEGMQLHMLGGFSASYEVDVPRAGEFVFVVRVATVQKGQKFRFSVNGVGPMEIDVPYTLGMWEHTQPITLELQRGTNAINLELVQGSRGVTVKDLKLKAVN